MKTCFYTDTGKDFFFSHSGKPIHLMEIGSLSLESLLEEYFGAESYEWRRGDEYCDLLVSLHELPEKCVLKEFFQQVSGTDAPKILKSTQNHEILAWWRCNPSGAMDMEIVWTDAFPIRLSYYWDLINLHEKLASSFSTCFDRDAVSPLSTVSGVLEMGEGSVILPGVVIEGFVRIGSNCKIGPNCFIRGCTSIGNNCIIGQSVEIKNSLIGSGTMVPHLSYVGDSVIGSNVNIGAGGICSNFRHDAGLHRVMLDGKLVETGRQKLGALIGDDAKIGCHTIIYPGRMIAAGKTSLPGEIISANKE